MAQPVEEVVAGHLQSVRGIDVAVGGAGDGGVKQTLGREACVLGEDALIGDLLLVFQQAVLHGGGEGAHLEGGTGGVVSAEGTVEEGLQGVRLDGVPVLVHGGQVVGGIAGAGQDLARLDLHDDHCGAFRVQTQAALFRIDPGVRDLGHDLRQGIFRDLLEGQVDGGLHVVAGFRILRIVLLDDGAVSGDHVHAGAVDAVEVLLEGFLEARLTDVGVHGVVLVLIFLPVGGVHTAHVAQDVGSVLGVVFPDGGGFDHEARGVQLQDGAEVLVGNVFHEGVGGQVGDASKVELVTHADDGAGFLVGPVVGDVIAGPELLQQQGRGDIGVQTAVAHVVLEIVLPCGGVVVEGIFEGTVLGHGEVIQVVHAQLQGLVIEPVEVIVTALGGLDDVVVEDQVITGAVAHQHLAVPVQDIAAGGADGGDDGVDGGIIGVAVGLDDLQGEELSRIQAHDQGKDQEQGDGPDAAYSFHV